MALYALRPSIPKNTASTSPVNTPLVLEPGRIRRVAVEFPPGCGGLLHVQILRGTAVVWPANPGQDLASDSHVIAWDEDYLVPQVEEWTVRAWNDDDIFPHAPHVYLDLVPAAQLEQGPAGVLARLGRLIGIGD